MNQYLSCLACIFLAAATCGGGTYDWRAGLSPRREAAFRLWVPDGAESVRNLVVLVPGRNGDARSWVDDSQWRDFARRWNCGLLGCKLLGDAYYIAREWSGGVVLESLDKLGVVSGQPQLAKARLFFFGHSAGAQFSCSFVDWRPGAVGAFVANKGNFKEWRLTADKRAIPGLWIVGAKDAESIAEKMTGSFCEGRRLGAAWALAVQPEGGHEIGPTKELAIRFLDAVFRTAKIDKKDQQPWLGNLRSHEIASAPAQEPDFQLNAWLLDKTWAEDWQAFTQQRQDRPGN